MARKRRPPARKRLPRPNVPFTLDAKIVNMLVAYEKIRMWPKEKWKRLRFAQQIAVYGALSEGEEAIAQRLFELWQWQYPSKFYVRPAIRSIKEFD